MSEEFDKIADFEALMSGWNAARAEVSRISALFIEERRKVAEVLAMLWPEGGARAVPFDTHTDLPKAVDWLLKQRVALTTVLDRAEAELAAMRPVVEAAEAWCEAAENYRANHNGLMKVIHDYQDARDSYRSRSADPAGEQGSGT